MPLKLVARERKLPSRSVAEFERFPRVTMTLLTHFTYTQDISYDCYAKHAVGLLKLLKLISVFYSEKYEVIIGLQSYCYIDVARATESIAETNQTYKYAQSRLPIFIICTYMPKVCVGLVFKLLFWLISTYIVLHTVAVVGKYWTILLCMPSSHKTVFNNFAKCLIKSFRPNCYFVDAHLIFLLPKT